MFLHLRKLASEGAIYGLAGILARVPGLVLLPVYGRLFAPAEYSLVGAVTAVVTLASILSVLGLDSAAHLWFWDRTGAEDRARTLSSWFYCQLTAATAGGLLVALALWLMRGWLTETPLSWGVAAWAGGTLVTNTFGIVGTNWMRMQRRPWGALLLGGATASLQLAAIFYLVAGLRRGVEGIYQGQVIAGLMVALLVVALMRRWLHPRLVSWERLRAMLAFGLPLVPGAVALWALQLSDRFWVLGMLSAAEAGIYHFNAQLASLGLLLTGALTQAWGPFILSRKEAPDTPRLCGVVFATYAAAGGILSVVAAVAAAPLVSWLAAPEYAEGAGCIGWLVLAVFGMGFHYIAGTGLAFAKRSAPLSKAVLLGAAVSVAGNALFVPRFGILASAVTAAAAQIVAGAFLVVAAQRQWPLPLPARGTAAVVALTVAGLAVLGGGRPGPGVGLAVVAVVAGASLVWLASCWQRLGGTAGPRPAACA